MSVSEIKEKEEEEKEEVEEEEEEEEKSISVANAYQCVLALNNNKMSHVGAFYFCSPPHPRQEQTLKR